jgi:hypothetical protein
VPKNVMLQNLLVQKVSQIVILYRRLRIVNITEATFLGYIVNLSAEQIPVCYYGFLMRNRGYILRLKRWGKQCWSYLRNIMTAINYFFVTNVLHIIYTHIFHRKNLAKHGDLQNTGIFYSKDLASASKRCKL